MPKKWEVATAGMVFVLSLAIYLITLAPSLFWWDSGEFIANVSVLGIPHRPGFPLYILLAKVFAFITAGHLVWRVNLFSALCASSSLSLAYLIFLRLSSHMFGEQEQRKFLVWTGLAATALLGFNYSFWIQAVRAEVYSLNLFLFLSLLWVLIRAENSQVPNFRHILLLSFLLGLSLGNHHAIILSTVPGLLFLLATSKSSSFSTRRISGSIFFFILGLSIYLYLPIRASQNPVFNWGNPSSLSAYLGNVLATDSIKQASWFSSLTISNLANTLRLFLEQLTVLPSLLSLFGFWVLYRANRRWLWFALIVTLGNWLLLSILTDQFIPNNPDLHGYLLPSLFIWCIAFGYGSFYLLSVAVKFFSQPVFTPGLRRTVTAILTIFFLGLSIIPFFRSKAAANLSSNLFPVSYAHQATANLETNSLVIIDNPNLDFLLRGLQYGQGYRKDLIVIDRTLLPAGWYCNQLKHNYPQLFTHIDPKLKGESLALNLAMNWLNQKKTVYWEFTERDSSLAKYLLPVGYLCRIVQDPQKFESAWEKQKLWEKQSLSWEEDPLFWQDGDAQRVWSRVMHQLGFFYQTRGNLAEAEDKYQRVLKLSPDEKLLTYRLKQIEEIRVRAEK